MATVNASSDFWSRPSPSTSKEGPKSSLPMRRNAELFLAPVGPYGQGERFGRLYAFKGDSKQPGQHQEALLVRRVWSAVALHEVQRLYHSLSKQTLRSVWAVRPGGEVGHGDEEDVIGAVVPDLDIPASELQHAPVADVEEQYVGLRVVVGELPHRGLEPPVSRHQHILDDEPE